MNDGNLQFATNEVDRTLQSHKMNLENSPHLVVPDPTVFEMLYGRNDADLNTFLNEESMTGLANKTAEFWVDLLKETFSSPRVVVQIFPSEELDQYIDNTEIQRVEKQVNPDWKFNPCIRFFLHGITISFFHTNFSRDQIFIFSIRVWLKNMHVCHFTNEPSLFTIIIKYCFIHHKINRLDSQGCFILCQWPRVHEWLMNGGCGRIFWLKGFVFWLNIIFLAIC